MNNPKKVIVYRSQAEQTMDEFWWSEGAFTGTNSGDVLILSVLLATSVIAGAYSKDKCSHRAKRIGATIVFFVTTFLFCFLGYRFWMHL